MKLDIHYFGMIAEAIKCTREEFILENKLTVSQLQHLLVKKYRNLEKLNYQIAIDKKLVNTQTLITNDAEIALLPPFAGG